MEEELRMKVAALCQKKFGGDYKKLFNFYDANKTGKLCSDDIDQLLSDADVGVRFTRPVIIYSLMQVIDKDKDGLLSVDELMSEMNAKPSKS